MKSTGMIFRRKNYETTVVPSIVGNAYDRTIDRVVNASNGST
jgi:hypothetical protein